MRIKLVLGLYCVVHESLDGQLIILNQQRNHFQSKPDGKRCCLYEPNSFVGNSTGVFRGDQPHRVVITLVTDELIFSKNY